MGLFRCGTLLLLPWNRSLALNHEATQAVRRPEQPPQEQQADGVTAAAAAEGGGTPSVQGLLPQPRWAPLKGPPLAFDSTAALEAFLAELGALVAEELRTRHYNTLGNLLHFYRAYREQGGGQSVAGFLRAYPPAVVPDGLSCVGLSLRLCVAVRRRFPRARPYLVSCEEWVPDVAAYCRRGPPGGSSVKEHVLVALRVQVGRRGGLVLLEPGYHVGFPIVVMEDGQAPHSGHFVQSHTAKSTKEYCYEAVGGGYVRWRVTETRTGHTKTWDNVLYVGGAFQSALAYSEKRNLLYDFRTLVARRDGRGPTAGVYCKLDDLNRNPVFTLFYAHPGGRCEAKLPFALFGRRAAGPPPAAVAPCALHIGMGPDQLLALLNGMADLYEDVDFVNQLLDLNRRVDPFEEEAALKPK